MAKVLGLSKVLGNLEKAEKNHRLAVAGAIYVEGQRVMSKSLRQVPVDTGRLRNSAYVGRPNLTGNPFVRLGYGTKYALAVHERTEVPHRVGKAKYLEDPMKEAMPGYVERVANRAKKLLGAGQGLRLPPKVRPATQWKATPPKA